MKDRPLALKFRVQVWAEQEGVRAEDVLGEKRALALEENLLDFVEAWLEANLIESDPVLRGEAEFA
jgi:predicted RNA-binding protein